MATELEKPRVTEIQVRMDCNGCVQKIKKALHGIHGIYDLYIDFPKQKITIVGSADPEKIVKAIKKTRKSAIICSHTEQADPPTQPHVEPAPADQGEAAQAPESANSPPTEAPPSESAPPTEPPKEPPKSPPPPPSQENHQPADEKRTPEGADNTKSQTAQPSKPRDVEEVHVIYHYPPDYGYRYNYGQGMSSHDSPRDYGYRYNYGQNMNNEPQNMSNEPPLRDYGYTRYNYGQTMNHETTPRDHGNTRYNYGQTTSHETSRDQSYNRYNYTQSINHELPRDHVAYRYNYDQNMSHDQPPRDFGYRSSQARPVGPEFRQEPSPPPPPSQPPIYATHNYNSYRASPYVTGYEYSRPPPQYTHYSRPEQYSEDYHNGNNSNGTIASVFSDENPNACTIV